MTVIQGAHSGVTISVHASRLDGKYTYVSIQKETKKSTVHLATSSLKRAGSVLRGGGGDVRDELTQTVPFYGTIHLLL